MLHQAVRAAFRLFGIHLPFRGAICVSGVQSITLNAEGQADVRIRRSLVFLQQPQPGDLRDTYALPTGETTSAVVFMSSDADELSREQTTRGLIVHWLPRDPVTRYALYEHHGGWQPTVTFDGPALCFEYECTLRTGAVTFELTAPTAFETAVVFARPAWRRRLTERQIARAALQAVKSNATGAQLSADGTQVKVQLSGPRAGGRYLFVAFRVAGVAECERWLRDTSLVGRLHRAAAGWAQAFTG